MSLIESMPHDNTQTHYNQSKNAEPHFNCIYALSYSLEMELKERLQKLLDESGSNATKLAEITKVPQPTIHRILTGESKDPRFSTLAPIAEHFGLTVAELRGDIPKGYYESQPITGDSNQVKIAEEPAIYYASREALIKDVVSQLNRQEVIQLVHLLVDSLNEKSG
ncbi:helix-turn-helix transcriptional regulator [Chromobacterium alkanivorans]|uniref:helix-turn-helix domain-containing protein n=1 Tax=Chromobacterium alkanivorans TaxID=1071719 RepID=UPI0019676D5C|nr:helix-turn-helix transcriptional regulator [Chromobacterium alkanivorans]MBN3003373.1 helix-turn-helix transcriptional regulator [Chromobacterium alkanivorans]